jgi:hypothetical protein
MELSRILKESGVWPEKEELKVVDKEGVAIKEISTLKGSKHFSLGP